MARFVIVNTSESLRACQCYKNDDRLDKRFIDESLVAWLSRFNSAICKPLNENNIPIRIIDPYRCFWEAALELSEKFIYPDGVSDDKLLRTYKDIILVKNELLGAIQRVTSTNLNVLKEINEYKDSPEQDCIYVIHTNSLIDHNFIKFILKKEGNTVKSLGILDRNDCTQYLAYDASFCVTSDFIEYELYPDFYVSRLHKVELFLMNHVEQFLIDEGIIIKETPCEPVKDYVVPENKQEDYFTNSYGISWHDVWKWTNHDMWKIGQTGYTYDGKYTLS